LRCKSTGTEPPRSTATPAAGRLDIGRPRAIGDPVLVGYSDLLPALTTIAGHVQRVASEDVSVDEITETDTRRRARRPGPNGGLAASGVQRLPPSVVLSTRTRPLTWPSTQPSSADTNVTLDTFIPRPVDAGDAVVTEVSTELETVGPGTVATVAPETVELVGTSLGDGFGWLDPPHATRPAAAAAAVASRTAPLNRPGSGGGCC
jgi:hypothetical protein